MSDDGVVWVRDDEAGRWHASTSARLERGAVVLDDARHAAAVCGAEIPAEFVNAWSEAEPWGKSTVSTCPDCHDHVEQLDAVDGDEDAPTEHRYADLARWSE